MQGIWIRDSLQYQPAQLRLFCFPYAGGGVSIFRIWQSQLPTSVQLCPVQLPGREDRLREKPHNRLQTLVSDLADALEPYINGLPFAFFGHSMGALISFELSRELRQRSQNKPLCLYLSAHRAAHLPDRRPPIHHLPDDRFLLELRRLEGTPKEVFEEQELMTLLLPALRADFALCETYTFAPQPPLSSRIVAFGGLEDREVAVEELSAWQEQTENSFKLWMLPGNHFFINSSSRQLTAIISADLHQLLPQS
ncbi:MAG: thioesterase II family protein [Planctomycetota bacterium]|jgi:surfactin synthase thioesterase subunit